MNHTLGNATIHISRAIIDDCQNLEESYGEICVYCDKCGRYSKQTDEEKATAEKEAEEIRQEIAKVIADL